MLSRIARLFGVRRRRQGQTTAEYAIIVALVAVASIAVILIFGNQIRALFAGEAKRLASDQQVQVENRATGADSAVSGSHTQF